MGNEAEVAQRPEAWRQTQHIEVGLAEVDRLEPCCIGTPA